MRKLRLRIDELDVETFGLTDESGTRGTVAGQGFTQDPVSGCWEITATCTQNPYEADCVSYAVQCPFTEEQGWTCGGSGCTEEVTCQRWCYENRGF